LKRSATRFSLNCAVWVSFIWLNCASSWDWMAALPMDGSKMWTFGPKSGVSDCAGQAAGVVPMVKVALATAESVEPDFTAMALTVVVAEMVSALL